MSKFQLKDLIPFIEEAFNMGKDFQIPITGTSMLPLLVQGRDFVKIVRCERKLEVGDIPLYRRDDGHFVLHRVVKVESDGTYTMCGDNQIILEKGITDKHVIGIVKTLIINGKEIDVETDAVYLKYKKKYVKNVKTRYPKRRLVALIRK